MTQPSLQEKNGEPQPTFALAHPATDARGPRARVVPIPDRSSRIARTSKHTSSDAASSSKLSLVFNFFLASVAGR
jgi:hypothetical protein